MTYTADGISDAVSMRHAQLIETEVILPTPHQ